MPVLAHDSICPLPCLRFGRLDLEAELLGHIPADKPANAVILPVTRLGNGLCRLSERRCFAFRWIISV